MKLRCERLPHWKHLLFLKEPLSITKLIDNNEYLIPRQAGLYGFTSIAERDNTIIRLNRASGNMEEIAIAVEAE